MDDWAYTHHQSAFMRCVEWNRERNRRVKLFQHVSTLFYLYGASDQIFVISHLFTFLEIRLVYATVCDCKVAGNRFS